MEIFTEPGRQKKNSKPTGLKTRISRSTDVPELSPSSATGILEVEMIRFICERARCATLLVLISAVLLFVLAGIRSDFGTALQIPASEVSRCVIAEIDYDFNKFHELVSRCSAVLNVREGDLLQLPSLLGELKYFLPMVKRMENSVHGCYFLTIGVGGTATAEAKFHSLYPNCQIFGIEPSKDQYRDFEKFGKVINLAVGPLDEVHEITLITRAGFVKSTQAVHALDSVLDDYLGTRVVQFATLDIEGNEYHILDKLRNGEILQKKKVVFCQLDVELHGKELQEKHLAEMSYANFSQFLRAFLTQSPYVPITGKKYLYHQKITFVHTANSMCEDFFNIKQLSNVQY